MHSGRGNEPVILRNPQRAIFQDLFHEDSPYRQGHIRTLPVSHCLEMDLPVLRTDPYPSCQGRGITDEPAVGMVVGGPCLARHFSFQAVFQPQPYARAAVDDSFHKVCHEICGLLADRFPLVVVEFPYDIPHAVFDPRDEHRLHIDAPRRERIVCRYHLIRRQVA